MASEIKSDKLSPSGGTALQIGDASDTITIPTGATFTITDGLGVAAGGTGLSSFTAGDVLYATGTTTLAKLAKGTAEQILSMNSGATAPEWATAAATAGGTGQTGFTAGDILYANSTTTLTKLGKGTGLQGLQTNSGATAPEWANSPQSLMTAAGDILYASGANTLAKLAKGSDDDVLTLASGVPSWAAAAGGGAWTLISTTTASSDATIDFTTFSTDYTDFMLIGTGVTAAANVSFPRMRYYVGGSVVTGSDYMWSCRAYDIENTGGQSMDGGSSRTSNATYVMLADPYDASAPTALGNTAGYNMNFTYYVSDVHSTTLWKNAWFWDTIVLGGSVPSQGQTANYFGGGLYFQTSALTGIQFYLSAGDVALGRFSLYGRKLT